MSSQAIGNCLNLFLNLIISNLFTGSINALIELIRIFSTNILTKYIISENNVRQYGIYLQPAITCILLFSIGLTIFYFIQWTSNGEDLTDSHLIIYIMYFFLFALIIVFVGTFVFYIFKIYKKKSAINNAIGYKINNED